MSDNERERLLDYDERLCRLLNDADENHSITDADYDVMLEMKAAVESILFWG